MRDNDIATWHSCKFAFWAEMVIINGATFTSLVYDQSFSTLEITKTTKKPKTTWKSSSSVRLKPGHLFVVNGFNYGY